jgi:hypothetical protein
MADLWRDWLARVLDWAGAKTTRADVRATLPRGHDALSVLRKAVWQEMMEGVTAARPSMHPIYAGMFAAVRGDLKRTPQSAELVIIDLARRAYCMADADRAAAEAYPSRPAESFRAAERIRDVNGFGYAWTCREGSLDAPRVPLAYLYDDAPAA